MPDLDHSMRDIFKSVRKKQMLRCKLRVFVDRVKELKQLYGEDLVDEILAELEADEDFFGQYPELGHA